MRGKYKKWTSEELTYLIENYANTPTSVLAKKMNRKATVIYHQAKKFGLKKSAEAREYSRKAVGYRKETPELANIICFYNRRGVDVVIAAKETNCPIEQVEDILERCRADGTYERYARQENSAMSGMISTVFDFSSRKPAVKASKNKSGKSERVGIESVQSI